MRLLPYIMAGLLCQGAAATPAEPARLETQKPTPWIGIDLTMLEVEAAELVHRALGATNPGDFEGILRAADLLDDVAERELIRWAVAYRLTEGAADETEHLLNRLASEPEALLIWEPGCRRGEMVPKWPVRATANLALDHLRARRLADSLMGSWDLLAELLDRADLSDRERLAVLKLATRDRKVAAVLRDALAAAQPLDAAREWLLVEVLALLGEAPDETVFGRLSGDGRWRLFEQQSHFADEEAQRLEKLLLQDPAIGAGIKKTKRQSIRQLLESGADGAVAASRERCAAWTERLGDLIDDVEVREQAVLALMLQDTELSRRVLIDAASAGKLSDKQQRKVMQWAAR